MSERDLENDGGPGAACFYEEYMNEISSRPMTHPWCTDVSRDAAVRAEEDGRQGALPTLEECIEGMFPKSVSRSSPVEPENKRDGMRTERVTLEITHEAEDNLTPPTEWDWTEALSMWIDAGYCSLKCRVVTSSEADAEVERLRTERDRWCAQSGIHEKAANAAQARVAEFEAERDGLRMETKTLTEENGKLRRNLEAASGGGESTNQPIADGRRPREEPAESATADSSPSLSLDTPGAPADGADATASGVGKHSPDSGKMVEQEPVAWGVVRNGSVESVTHRRFRGEAECCAARLGGTVVPLYRELPPTRGWLTNDQREAVETARDHFDNDDLGDSECVFIARMMKQILARSTPPEVVLPPVHCHGEHGEPLVDADDVRSALAAAGVTVKEVA